MDMTRVQKWLHGLSAAPAAPRGDRLFLPPKGESGPDYRGDTPPVNRNGFFYEPEQFSVLAMALLPLFLDREAAEKGRPYTVWSAGCATGEEPYSLAMALSESEARYPGFHFSVLATDASSESLNLARLGIYDEARTTRVPEDLKKKYLMQSKDRGRKLVRIAPEVRSCVRFQQLDLLDEDLTLREELDSIFCRNVTASFDRAEQEELLRRMCRLLRPGGHLFLGRSEAALGFDLPLTPVMHRVYRKG
jgi:chemotaxis protein methyltransferase CheR